jgi:hypothetical protein
MTPKVMLARILERIPDTQEEFADFKKKMLEAEG